MSSAVESLALLRSAAVLVGFHPDQATEPCVDFALRRRIPFVVVPCCVFQHEFPERRLARRGRSHGQAVTLQLKVRKYEDLICYLQSKHPRMRRAELDFEKAKAVKGSQVRCTALYMLPEDFEE